MIKGKTKSGFEFEIDTGVMDDMELVDALAELQDNALMLPKIISLILGSEQRKRLYVHLRDEKGRVSATAVGREITEILESCKSGKNS